MENLSLPIIALSAPPSRLVYKASLPQVSTVSLGVSRSLTLLLSILLPTWHLVKLLLGIVADDGTRGQGNPSSCCSHCALGEELCPNYYYTQASSLLKSLFPRTSTGPGFRSVLLLLPPWHLQRVMSGTQLVQENHF